MPWADFSGRGIKISLRSRVVYSSIILVNIEVFQSILKSQSMSWIKFVMPYHKKHTWDNFDFWPRIFSWPWQLIVEIILRRTAGLHSAHSIVKIRLYSQWQIISFFPKFWIRNWQLWTRRKDQQFLFSIGWNQENCLINGNVNKIWSKNCQRKKINASNYWLTWLSMQIFKIILFSLKISILENSQF